MFEVPNYSPETSEQKNYFEWNGKKVEHDEGKDILTIKNGELSEIELEAFKKHLRQQFPDAQYSLVEKPYLESNYLVFERMENQMEEEKDEQMSASESQKQWENEDSKHAA